MRRIARRALRLLWSDHVDTAFYLWWLFLEIVWPHPANLWHLIPVVVAVSIACQAANRMDKSGATGRLLCFLGRHRKEQWWNGKRNNRGQEFCTRMGCKWERWL